VTVSFLESLFSSLAGERVSDVLVQGYIDRDNAVPRFVPLADVWYLALDSGFLQLKSYGYEGQLTMRLVSGMESPEELVGEDEEFAVASHGDLFFDTAGPSLPITKIRYATTERSDLESGIVRLVEFELFGSQRIVADPMWHFGIRPGPAGVYERLVADCREAGNSVTEFVWSP
jgi:hypothetical protein